MSMYALPDMRRATCEILSTAVTGETLSRRGPSFVFAEISKGSAGGRDIVDTSTYTFRALAAAKLCKVNNGADMWMEVLTSPKPPPSQKVV